VLTVASGGFSVENLGSPLLSSRSSGFYPPHCYQASLVPRVISTPRRICLPLTPPRFGFSCSAWFYSVDRSPQRQVRRVSLGKTHHLPISRPASHRFDSSGYQVLLCHACSTFSPTPYSRFAVRYVHGFCLMLPSDPPFLVDALALLALLFRPVTASGFFSSILSLEDRRMRHARHT